MMGNVVPEGNMKKSWYHSIDVGSLELINNIHILGRECDTSMSGSSPAINLAAEPGLLHFLYKQMVLYLRHLCHWIVVENVHSRAIFVILFLREVVAVFCSVVESTSQAMPSVGILSSETSLLMRKNQSREKNQWCIRWIHSCFTWKLHTCFIFQANSSGCRWMMSWYHSLVAVKEFIQSMFLPYCFS